MIGERTSDTGTRSVFGCIPNGVAFARIAPFSGWKLRMSSKGRASPITSEARDFALSFWANNQQETNIALVSVKGTKRLLFSIVEKRKRVLDYVPKSMSKMTTRAPLLLAPNASALPAPPAPASTNILPASGEPNEAVPFLYPRSVTFQMHRYHQYVNI